MLSVGRNSRIDDSLSFRRPDMTRGPGSDYTDERGRDLATVAQPHGCNVTKTTDHCQETLTTYVPQTSSTS